MGHEVEQLGTYESGGVNMFVAVLDSLVESKILGKEEKAKLLGLTSTTVYPTRQIEVEASLKKNLRDFLVAFGENEELEPDLYQGFLLAHCVGHLDKAFGVMQSSSLK